MATAPRTPRRPRRPTTAPARPPRRLHRRIGPAALGAFALLLVLFLVLGGGRERTPAAEIVRPAPASEGFVQQNVGLGTLIDLPLRPWSTRGCDDQGGGPDPDTQPDLRCVVTSGPGVLSVWIYARGRRGPSTPAALDEARRDLVAASRQRNRTFRPVASTVTRYDRLNAIQVRGTAEILGRPRTIRSTHVFVGGREIVIDAYSTNSSFRRVDQQVFRRVLRSLEVAPDWRRVRAQDDVPGVSR